MNLTKQGIINHLSPDLDISHLQTTQPRLYRAIKNIGDANKNLINSIYPPLPIQSFRKTFYIEGSPFVIDDILTYRYHVILPTDPAGNWNFKSINLISCVITTKIQGASDPLSIDIKVSQQKGTTAFKSLFQPGFNPILQPGFTFANNVKFAINSLLQDDLLRVDVLSTDLSIAGISIDLVGNYVISEVSN